MVSRLDVRYGCTIWMNLPNDENAYDSFHDENPQQRKLNRWDLVRKKFRFTISNYSVRTLQLGILNFQRHETMSRNPVTRCLLRAWSVLYDWLGHVKTLWLSWKLTLVSAKQSLNKSNEVLKLRIIIQTYLNATMLTSLTTPAKIDFIHSSTERACVLNPLDSGSLRSSVKGTSGSLSTALKYTESSRGREREIKK